LDDRFWWNLRRALNFLKKKNQGQDTPMVHFLSGEAINSSSKYPTKD
jgi:hypothetical protein